MEQNQKKFDVGVIGAGPAGCVFACFSNENVVLFEKDIPLKTLLCTGGGRCNLAYAEYDLKSLASNYPRGEKFLYSIFSKFSTKDSINFFDSIGVETYIQPDKRIFPKSNSAKDVRDAILRKIENNGTRIIKEKVVKLEKNDCKFVINDKYIFDKVVFSTGGHAGYELVEKLGHKIVEPKPSLVGLITKEKFMLEGLSLKDVEMNVKGRKSPLVGDLLFTRNGISGPLAFIVSSIFSRDNYSEVCPIELTLDFKTEKIVDLLNKNGKKLVKTCISDFVPKSLANFIVSEIGLQETKCCEVSKNLRLKLEKYLSQFPITVIGHENSGEIVTSGGVSLKEIDPKTMQSKLVEGLYFCGEVIDIDGFCGGFNLQNAWSNAFVCAASMV